MVAIFLWHVATRAIYEQKEEYMNELLHHIFLFLEFLMLEYTMMRNTLWKRVSVIKFPEGNKTIVYITIFIVSNRHLPNTKQEHPLPTMSVGVVQCIIFMLYFCQTNKVQVGIAKNIIIYNGIRYIYDTFWDDFIHQL